MKQKAFKRGHSAVALAIVMALPLLASMDGSAGIQGTGRMFAFAYGRITAFGSIFVDGVEYDIAKAQILINGRPGHSNQLEVGQLVAVQGVESGAGQGSAFAVTYTGNVVGPVAQVDVGAKTFSILGQNVQVDAATLFGTGIQPASLSALPPGTGVDVSAFVNASGVLVASRIDLQAAGTALQVVGAVEDLNTGAETFEINNLRIDYGQAVVEGKLANASTATVWANEYPAAGTLHVTRVQLSNGVGAQSGAAGRVEGLVTSIGAGGSFYVGNQLVDTNSQTNFSLHGQSLAANLSVRVAGRFDSSGALLAKKVQADPKAP